MQPKDSSPYHLESQGALEHWHQTLKSMLSKYCLQSAELKRSLSLCFQPMRPCRNPLGLIPAALVFRHTHRGPLKTLAEKLLSTYPSPQTCVLEYLSRFREQLHNAKVVDKESLSSSQDAMKHRFHRSAVSPHFQVGDKVL